MAITETLFAIHFPLQLEPVIYGITERMAKDYDGGFYMAPSSDERFEVTCDNFFQGELSADALGITSCLYAYSNLSFSGGSFAEDCARQYHLLREHMLEHPEVRGILGATD